MRRFIKDNTYHTVYDNLHEFFQSTDLSKTPQGMHSDNASDWRELKGNSSWRYGDDRTKDKFYEVRFDSTKGKTMCADAVKKTTQDSTYKKLLRQAMTYRKRIKYEDHGFRLNVSKAIGGEDRYFGVYKNSRKPIVKIAINICGSACVDAEQFKKVAQTAIPAIYALETAGICTEVYYCAFSKGTHKMKEADYSAVHVKIKSSQERFNWTTFAPVFCLGSYRESIFAAWISSDYEVNSGLGTPMRDSVIFNKNNFGYTSVIGLNGVGAIDTVTNIFEKIGKKEC